VPADAGLQRTSSWCRCVAVCCGVLRCVAVYLRMQVPDVQVRGIRILLIKTMHVCIEDKNFVRMNVPRIRSWYPNPPDQDKILVSYTALY